MKQLILLIALVCSFFSIKSFSFELRTGDVLLQPLKCWSCTLIEQQEDSEYAHIGMAIIINGEEYVAEAYGKVKVIPLQEFLKKTAKGKKVKVRRADYHFLQFTEVQKSLINKTLEYVGNPYDANFLWDNNINGQEALYCSELVYKVLNYIIPFNQLAPKPMLFDVNPDYWDRYFRGNTPRGHLGISPEDFNSSDDFYTLGEL